jgi:hypothetical protein
LRMVVEHSRDRGGGNTGGARHVDDGGHGCAMLLMTPRLPIGTLVGHPRFLRA